jgi:hypothetical protein
MDLWKLALVALCLVLSATNAQGAVPSKISYQGLLADQNGVIVPDANYNLRFSLYNVLSGGSYLWQEDHFGVPVEKGRFNVILGSVTPITGIAFEEPYWLAINVNGGPELSPRVEIVSSPYAFCARTVTNDVIDSTKIKAGGISFSDIGRNTATTGQVIKWNGSAWVPQSDDANTGDITAVGVGSGLTGGGLTGAVTVSVADSGITNAHVSATAGIEVTKISGTAVNLGSIQTITGAKSFDLDGGSSAVQAIYAIAHNSSGAITDRYGVKAEAGEGTNTAGNSYALYGSAQGGANAYGVYATATGAGTLNRAGQFEGDVDVNGALTKTSGAFRIDHPLDPENKYLQHSFVESPDMMNIYNGNVILDAAGEANVDLPSYFEALNFEFRYQLTSIGSPAPNLHISSEISGGRFAIAGGQPSGKVSWQVTGIRNDKWAEQNRIQVEVDKPLSKRGLYRTPELYGFGPERAIDDAQRPNSQREK